MINDTVEDYFDKVLNYSFSDMLPLNGVPTAQIEATFSAPSRMGDMLNISLEVTESGRSSMKLVFKAHCDDQLRFSAKSVLVFVDENGKSTPWPDSIRSAINSAI